LIDTDPMASLLPKERAFEQVCSNQIPFCFLKGYLCTMNFRLFRTSLFITTLILLRFGVIQAHDYIRPVNIPIHSFQAAHEQHQPVVFLPIEITEDNEVNDSLKRLSSGSYAILLACHFINFKVYSLDQYVFVSAFDPPSAPTWLKNCVFRI
jgi:hypothetical protein